MTESETIDVINKVMGATNLHYTALAVVCGVSSSTTRAVLLTGRLPARSHARRRLEEFARANADARTRGDLRFVDG